MEKLGEKYQLDVMSAVEQHLHFFFRGELQNQGPELQLVSLILETEVSF